MVVPIPSLFPQQIAFSREADLAALLGGVPGKWAVYLFLDESGAPFQLLSVRNLRASLARRLGAENELAPGRKVPYRHIVRGIAWQRVDSALEADLLYAQAAEAFFPASYRQFIGARRCWFIQVSPQARFPVFSKTETPQPTREKRIFGPLSSRAAAQKFIESIEDAFDLCRYPSILAQSPHGVACPYKQMHKCPAPCDGSVPLNLYCMQLDAAVAFLQDSAPEIEQHAQRMHAAARSLLFEQAGRCKAYVQQLEKLAEPGLQQLSRMHYLAVQRGPWAQTFKLMAVSPWYAKPLLCLRGADEAGCEAAMAEAMALAEEPREWSEACLERLALLSHHLMHPSADARLLPLATLRTPALEAIVRELSRRKAEAERPTGDEGVVQDSQ